MQQMTWQEICQRYPDEWVAVVNYERKGAVEVDGAVAAHAPEKKKFHEHTAELLEKYGTVALRYTGELVQESNIPLLWRISHTA